VHSGVAVQRLRRKVWQWEPALQRLPEFFGGMRPLAFRSGRPGGPSFVSTAGERRIAVARALNLAWKETERQNTLLALGLHCVLTEKPDSTQSAQHGDWKYEYRLYRGLAPHGGVVVLIAETDGQRPSVTVQYLEDLRHDTRAPLELRVAIERLTVARNNLADTALSGPRSGGLP
jgi:hypothetical protein